jgi:hypothetical protein
VKLPRRRLRPEAVLDRDLRDLLETGSDLLNYFGRKLSDEELREKLREQWRRHGARVTRRFIARHPGQRPACWWWFEAPAPRLVAPPPDGDRWRNWEERDLFQRLLDELFLMQHGLLTARERRVLDKEAAAVKRMADELEKHPPDPVVPDWEKKQVN